MIKSENNTLKTKLNSKRLANLLIVWFFVTILPQILLLTREDSGNFIIKIALLIIFVFSAFYYMLKNPIKFNYISILGWIYFVLIQLLSNVVFKPSIVENNFGVYINIILSSIYILFYLVIFDKFTLSIQDIRRFCKFYLIIIVYACIYNIIKNYNILGSVFSITSTYEYSLSSFFSNRNTFAIFLSFGIVSCFILNDTRDTNKNNKFILNACLAFFGANLILTNARTSIFAVIIYMTCRYFLINKKNFFKFIVKMIIISAVVVIIIWITGLGRYIVDIVIRPNSGFTKRDIIWKTGLEVFWGNNIIFGTGEVYPRMFIEAITGNTGFHNTYISILVFGGISLFIFYLILIKKSFDRCKVIIRYDRKVGINFMSIILMYLASSMAEANILFYSSALNVIATIFVVLLPKYYFNYFKSGGTEIELLE